MTPKIWNIEEKTAIILHLLFWGKKMKEYVHKTRMAPSRKNKQGHNSETAKVIIIITEHDLCTTAINIVYSKWFVLLKLKLSNENLQTLALFGNQGA